MRRAGPLLIVGLALGLPAFAGQSAPPRSPEEELARWDRMFTTEPAHIRWEPSRFLIEVAPTLEPGDAIDVGMGSGRNALYLAQSGWRVTGVDTSAVGVEHARARATANKLAFAAVQSDMFKFDYGSNRYDLVLFMYMGPVGDLGERLVRALKPGGYLLIEHFAGGFEAGSLPTLFKGLNVLRYSEDEDFPDYDLRNKGRVVRFLGQKPSDPSVAVGQSTISIALKQNTIGEAETRDQLQRLLKTYDMSPWFYTKSVVIDERAIPFSHPVLTLHTRHAKDDELLLSTFVHEQLHWFFSGRPEQTEQAIADLRKAFPDAPAGGTAGARDQSSTYLHLLVCFLERQGVSRVLGELKAQQVIEFWATDHYTWVYRQVLDHGQDIAAILKTRQLLPAR